MVALFKPNVKRLRNKKDIEGLINVLRYEKKSNVRVRAVQTLGEVGDSRIAVKSIIISALKDENSKVREKAAESLRKMDERAVDPLIQDLKDVDSDVRRYAVEALGKIGGDKRAVDPLIQDLKDVDSDVRRYAVEALGKIGDKRAVEPLIQALKDNYQLWEVREKAVESLGKIRDKRAVEPLIQALKDEIGEVREKAMESLEKMGAEMVHEPLIKALGDWRRQIEALWILAKIEKNPEIIPYIISWLFANPRRYRIGRFLDLGITSDYLRWLHDEKRYKELYSDLYMADDALVTLSAQSNIDVGIIRWIIVASSFSISYSDMSGDWPFYEDAIDATKELCKINNAVASNVLYMISQKKGINIELSIPACRGGGSANPHISFEEQRKIASEELKRRGFTKYDPSAYFKKTK